MAALSLPESMLITTGHTLGYSDRVIQLGLHANRLNLSSESIDKNNIDIDPHILCRLLFRICARFLQIPFQMPQNATPHELQIEHQLEDEFLPHFLKIPPQSIPSKYGQIQQMAEVLEILKNMAQDMKNSPKTQEDSPPSKEGFK